MKAKILFVTLVLFGYNALVQGDLVWDSGHHEYSEGEEGFLYMHNDASVDMTGGKIYEFYMYNNTTANIDGGYVGILWGQNTSSVDVYDGSEVDVLRPNDSSVANVYGGEINTVFVLGNGIANVYEASLNYISASNDGEVNLYVQYYDYDPAGSDIGKGLLTGAWLDSGNSFSINIISPNTLDHINYIPEPTMLYIFIIGGMSIINKNRVKT